MQTALSLHGKEKNVELAAFSSTFDKNSHKKVSSTLRKNVELMLNCEAFYPNGYINTIKGLPYFVRKPFVKYNILWFYFVKASCTATATATVAPTIGLLPMPIRPIISTCAGTEEDPANCASECIRPIVSVMP